MADECKNEYAAQLQNFNAEQWKHFNNAIPHIFKVLQASAVAALLTGSLQVAKIEKNILSEMCLRICRTWINVGR